MEDFFSTVGPWLGAIAGFVGFKGAMFMLAGAWVSDILRRRWPIGFGWLRDGFKKAGDSLKG